MENPKENQQDTNKANTRTSNNKYKASPTANPNNAFIANTD